MPVVIGVWNKVGRCFSVITPLRNSFPESGLSGMSYEATTLVYALALSSSATSFNRMMVPAFMMKPMHL